MTAFNRCMEISAVKEDWGYYASFQHIKEVETEANIQVIAESAY